MRFVGGIASGRLLGSASVGNSSYAPADGVEPKLLFDPENNVFKMNGSAVDDAWDVFENDGASTPLDMATVIDSDGGLKWPLHNLYTGGTATATTQSITVKSGVQHTVSFKGTGSVTFTNGATGSLAGTGADDRVTTDITPTTTTVTCTVSGSVTEITFYRSDLAGMQTPTNTVYLEAPSGAKFTLGIHYSGDGTYQGSPLFKASQNTFAEGDPNLNWGSPWNDTGGTSTNVTQNLLGFLPGREVTSGGSNWHRIDTSGFLSFTSGNKYAITYVYRKGTSPQVALRIRNNDTGLESIVADANVEDEFEAIETDFGTLTGIVVDRIEATEDYIAQFIFTPNATTSSGELGFGPYSTTSGQTATLGYVQIESSDTPTCIIPNLNGTDTNSRSAPAPVVTASAAGVGSGQGTVFAEFSPLSQGVGTDDRTVWAFDDGDADEEITTYFDPGAGVESKITDSGSQQALLQEDSFYSQASLTYNSNIAVLSANGRDSKTKTSSVTVPTVTTVRLGHSVSGEYLNGFVKKFAIYSSEINQSDNESLSDTSIPGTVISDPTAPVNTVVPLISGNLTAGSVLTVDNGTFTGTKPITYTYQWKRDGSNIGSATNSTYTTVDPTDVGTTITCQVTATNDQGSANATSNGVVISDAVEPPPTNAVAPVISGGSTVGQLLTTTDGSWNGTVDSYSYQWKRDGSSISGATSSTYTIVSADSGNAITCEVTATNTGGSNSAVSNSITPTSASGAAGDLSLHTSISGVGLGSRAGFRHADMDWSGKLGSASIYKVTNRNNSGSGSFRDAVTGTSNGSIRFVVFEVGGTIELTSDLDITRDNLVVLGETAPGDGIQIRAANTGGREIRIRGKNIIIGHINFRIGWLSDRDSGDGLVIGAGSYRETANVKLYNCSIQTGQDEQISIKGYSTKNISNVSVVDCLLSHPIRQTQIGGYKGFHTFGPLVLDDTDRIEFARNLIIGHRERNPSIEGGSDGGEVTMISCIVGCTSDGDVRRTNEAPMGFNHWTKTGNTYGNAMWNVGHWRSSRDLFVLDRKENDSGGSNSNYTVNRYADGNYLRDWKLTSTLFAEGSPNSGGKGNLVNRTTPSARASHKGWNTPQNVELYVPQHAGAFPARRDGFNQLAIDQYYNDQITIITNNNVPSYSFANTSRSITTPSNPFSIGGSGFPAIVDWAEANYHIPAGGLPYE